MRPGRISLTLVAIATVGALASCSDGTAGEAGAADSPATTASALTTTAGPESTPAAQTRPPATDPPATTPATTLPPATAPTTTAPATTTASTPSPSTDAPEPVADDGVVQEVEIGRSIEGRPIVATERGTPGGTVVLVIGSIHGDEDDGIAVVRDLRRMGVPDDVDLWLVESMNPDGNANQVRGNANGVDLNRNFPFNWQPLSVPGDWQYGGSGPASEPETQVIVNFVDQIRPALTIWYHQDLFRISPGEGLDGLVRARYAELTGLPLLRVTGGTYTGVAATWLRQTMPDSIAFIVELGDTLSPEEAQVHAGAVLDVSSLMAGL